MLDTPPLRLVFRPARWEIEVFHQQQSVLGYAMSPFLPRPHVRGLHTLAGDSLLPETPADSAQPRGLTFGFSVNGTNFWDEVPPVGAQFPSPLPVRFLGRTPTGLPYAFFRHSVLWLDPTNRTAPQPVPLALLTEERALTLTVDKAEGELALHWRSAFAVGDAAGAKAVLTGGPDHGLILPLPEDRAGRVRHVRAGTSPPPGEPGPHESDARWIATHHERDGRAFMTVVMVGPRNAGTPRFVIRSTPQPSVAATQSLDRTPLEYRAGQTFRLDYLVLAYDRPRSPAELEDRYRRWTAEIQTAADGPR